MPARREDANVGSSQVDPGEFLRRMIMTGKFKAGERLPPERQLAVQLGCSRGLVREAISQLAAVNLVVSRHGDGTYVTALTSAELIEPLAASLSFRPESLLHLLELRQVIEPWVAAGAAQRITPEGVVQLIDLAREYNMQTINGDEAELIRIDERIHDILADAHGNPLFVTILRALRDAAREGRSVTVHDHENLTVAASALMNLVHAVANRDSVNAQIAMSAHIYQTRTYAKSVLEPPHAPDLASNAPTGGAGEAVPSSVELR